MNEIKHTNITKPSTQPKEGQFYYHPVYKSTYLLARVASSKFALVNLSTGDRWATNPEEDELSTFVNAFPDFILVANPFTITPNV